MAAKLPLSSFGKPLNPDSIYHIDHAPIILDPTKDPWEKQPGESTARFGLFCAYLEMGTNRSMAQVARDSHRHYQAVMNISSKFRWRERAEAWEISQAVKLRQAIEEDRKKMISRHITVSALLLDKLQERIELLVPKAIKVKDIASLLKASVDIERLSRGEATSRVDVRNIVETLAKAEGLSEDETKQAVSEVERYLKEMR